MRHRPEPRQPVGSKVALIGTVDGLALLRVAAAGFAARGLDVVVLLRFPAEPPDAGALSILVTEDRVCVIPLPGRPRSSGSWLGDGVGGVSDLIALRSRVPDIDQRTTYVYGPRRWTRLVERTLESAGTPPDRVHTVLVAR